MSILSKLKHTASKIFSRSRDKSNKPTMPGEKNGESAAIEELKEEVRSLAAMVDILEQRLNDQEVCTP
jgi:hypothetical protein